MSGKTLAEFFAMGGYAWFVWPSYLAALALMGGNILAARSSHRQAVRQARRRLQTQAQAQAQEKST